MPLNKATKPSIKKIIKLHSKDKIIIIQGFWTIVFIFIVIFTMFQLMCPPAIFRCFLLNLEAYMELQYFI